MADQLWAGRMSPSCCVQEGGARWHVPHNEWTAHGLVLCLGSFRSCTSFFVKRVVHSPLVASIAQCFLGFTCAFIVCLLAALAIASTSKSMQRSEGTFYLWRRDIFKCSVLSAMILSTTPSFKNCARKNGEYVVAGCFIAQMSCH